MEPNRRFTILTFPQRYDGQDLHVNIVVLPRNQNPLMAAIEGAPPIPDAVAFADAHLSLVARIVTGSVMPTIGAALPGIALPTAVPPNARKLFEALATQFTITNLGAHNTNTNVNNPSTAAPAAVPVERSVQKYLPQSYRQAFNFVAPRIKNAVTDDTYLCAVRDAGTPIAQSPDTINWGQVFAYAMRQPLLAEALGMIYRTHFPLDVSKFSAGGWLFIDLAAGSAFRPQEDTDDTFARRYAARIPPLDASPRTLFAALQFPVLAAPPPGSFDALFLETAEYDEGFAKVVHSFQPVSANLLLEESDGAHPTHEAGIRLGWDDEQILIWYVRQLAEDSTVGPAKRIDAPLGVSGFRVDVREAALPVKAWQSLNLVDSRHPLTVRNLVSHEAVAVGAFIHRELPYQVYPSQLDGDTAKSYWLPMYFASWSGGSIVLPDSDAAAIYQHDDVKADPLLNVGKAPGDDLNKTYTPTADLPALRYGHLYDFRVRLTDLSGGGPAVAEAPAHQTASQVTRCHFKRFVAPNAVRMNQLPMNDDGSFFGGDTLTFTRPLLGYPAVVFTGKYANPITLLKTASVAMTGKEAFGISDPDVQAVEITVEVQTLGMDTVMSVSKQEAYIKLYATTRAFPTASATFDDELAVDLEFRDCAVLNFGDPADLGDLGVDQAQIDAMDRLVLPTARLIRLTVRAVCEPKANYYGLEQDDHDFNTRYGRIVQFQLARPSRDETSLFATASPVDVIRGIYLQPDPVPIFDGNLASLLLGKETVKPPDIVQRLAQQLGVDCHGLTLVGKRGQRVQFGCSSRIRHTLSPDNSSLTFASKGDLTNHWLCAITAELHRDWTWNALQDRSVVVTRLQRFREDDEATETDKTEVGDIEIKRTAPFNALESPDRSRTRLIFLDAVEPKNARTQPPVHQHDPRFPDLIELKYTLHPQLLDSGTPHDDDLEVSLELPIVLPPAQVPKIVSAGLALTPYVRNARYSKTESRRRYLWIEFEEPIADVKDTYFARVLAYAPDQLISNNEPDLFVAPDEPVLPIDPEPVRVIAPAQPHDDAGLDAMQPMEQAVDSDRFYLLPLPPGLHAESPEMFGLFTYELRVGHYQYTDTTNHHTKGEHVWCTAQGRFGRPLRVTGLQHPAPTLTCTVDRDEEKVMVTAPFAVAVHNGRDVTADPPRTELWALLYAQVRQADNLDFRNILLDDRPLDWRIRIERDRQIDITRQFTEKERVLLKDIAIANFRDDVDYARYRRVLTLHDRTTLNRDATKHGTAIWTNPEVKQLLERFGLPQDSALSVLCVEILPQIANVYDHVRGIDNQRVHDVFRQRVGGADFPSVQSVQREMSVRSLSSSVAARPRPLTNALGHYRILRTSPLAEVPAVCCPEC